MKAIHEYIRRHKTGEAVGIASVCSAHPTVLESALRLARARQTLVLIESTSNQVNQFGGYTGLRAADFRDYVHGIADRVGVARDRILLGGDHLGPNCWQGLAAHEALDHSDRLIASYVDAGFRKIHLDCSMACADDPPSLSDEVVAQRAARLCAVAESTWQQRGGEPPVYVIGTEVPVPGGAHEDVSGVQPTTAAAAGATIDVHHRAFVKAGLEEAWERVVALVVQPGVEFDHHQVIDYKPQAAADLARLIEQYPGLIYEAHSTDYQTPAALNALVRDHFAILKVGPGLTYALRETLWALADLEQAWLGKEGQGLKQTMLALMQADPKHWAKYYQDPQQLTLDLQYSLSDRVRYYWNHPDATRACERLVKRLAGPGGGALPLTLLSQFLPWHYQQVRDRRVGNSVTELILAGVERALVPYWNACSQSVSNQPMEHRST